MVDSKQSSGRQQKTNATYRWCELFKQQLNREKKTDLIRDSTDSVKQQSTTTPCMGHNNYDEDNVRCIHLN